MMSLVSFFLEWSLLWMMIYKVLEKMDNNVSKLYNIKSNEVCIALSVYLYFLKMSSFFFPEL